MKHYKTQAWKSFFYVGYTKEPFGHGDLSDSSHIYKTYLNVWPLWSQAVMPKYIYCALEKTFDLNYISRLCAWIKTIKADFEWTGVNRCSMTIPYLLFPNIFVISHGKFLTMLQHWMQKGLKRVCAYCKYKNNDNNIDHNRRKICIKSCTKHTHTVVFSPM